MADYKGNINSSDSSDITGFANVNAAETGANTIGTAGQTIFVGSLTGNADTATTVTTNANLTGDVTSVGNATTIAAKAVDVAMLADGTDGELITWDATGVAATVATGTSGQILTSNGAGTAPTFQAASVTTSRAIGIDTWTPAAATDTRVVTHNLGVVPGIIKITLGQTTATANAESITWGTGMYDGTNYSTFTRKGSGTNTVHNASSTHIIDVGLGSIGAGWNATITSNLANSFTLDVGTFSSSVPIDFTYEVIA